MAKNIEPNLKTGHFHISKIQDESTKEDLKPTEIMDLFDIVKNGIKEGIKRL